MFLNNVDCLLCTKIVIHHSDITGEIIGYVHSFCNLKVRENKNQISVVAHNLFGFDFFLKDLRLVAWRTTDLSIGGKNLTSINFANIADQIKFIDTIQNYQQSLSVLASTMIDEEIFIENNPKLHFKFQKCSDIDKEWILNYLSSGKGVIPYEMILRYDSLDIVPEDEEFFLPHHFYSSLKDTVTSREDYEAVKKLYRTMNLENLGELNKLYNFQDTIILCETFE